MKYWANTYYKGDQCIYNHASKSFQKALIKYTETFFLENVGEILNPKEISICFPCEPIYLDSNAETFVEKFQLGGYAGPYVFICKLYWWHKDKTHEIKLLDEVKTGEIDFRIEVYEGAFESLRQDLLTRARLKNEQFVEGYRFVVHIKSLMTDCKLRIKLNSKVNKEIVEEVSKYLGDIISESNELEENGLIHSYKLLSSREQYINFMLNIGSGTQNAIKYLLNGLNISSYSIVKVEFSKL